MLFVPRPQTPATCPSAASDFTIRRRLWRACVCVQCAQGAPYEQIAPFSSAGLVPDPDPYVREGQDLRIKPDLVAPGYMRSAAATNVTAAALNATLVRPAPPRPRSRAGRLRCAPPFLAVPPASALRVACDRVCVRAFASPRAQDPFAQEDCATVNNQGTSMAAPVVAGSALLARQYFVDGFYPSGARLVPGGLMMMRARRRRAPPRLRRSRREDDCSRVKVARNRCWGGRLVCAGRRCAGCGYAPSAALLRAVLVGGAAAVQGLAFQVRPGINLCIGPLRSGPAAGPATA